MRIILKACANEVSAMTADEKPREFTVFDYAIYEGVLFGGGSSPTLIPLYSNAVVVDAKLAVAEKSVLATGAKPAKRPTLTV